MHIRIFHRRAEIIHIWGAGTRVYFPFFAEKLLNKRLIMKIIAEKKEAERVLKVENSSKVGNSDTREKKMA